MTNDSDDRVLILLATFNGAKFLNDLLHSIERQTYANWALLVRDDLSTDATLEILSGFANKHPGRVKVIEASENVGSKENFNLLFQSIFEEPYIMFCDQDDIWLSNKIELSLAKLKEIEKAVGKYTPSLVHTDLKVVGENLSVAEKSFWKYQKLNPEKSKKLNFLLCQNYVTGCTVILNNALAKKTKSIPDLAIMHDYWVSLVCACFGEVGYIDQSTILYRQHQSNEVGAKSQSLYAFVMKLLNLLRGKGWHDYHYNLIATQRQAECLLKIYHEDLSDVKKRLVQTYMGLSGRSFFKKRMLLIRYSFFKSNLLSNLGQFLRI